MKLFLLILLFFFPFPANARRRSAAMTYPGHVPVNFNTPILILIQQGRTIFCPLSRPVAGAAQPVAKISSTFASCPQTTSPVLQHL